MSRPVHNIAIFLDGTWNEVEDYTNVYRLYELSLGLELDTDVDSAITQIESSQNTNPQVRYYDSGVGTSITSPMMLGGALGYGLRRNVAQAYLTVCQQIHRCLEKNHNYRLYIFGFSRGAYTARSLGGLLENFGLLKRSLIETHRPATNRLHAYWQHRQMLKHALRAVDQYRLGNRASNSEGKQRIHDRFRQTFCTTENGNANDTGTDSNSEYRVPIHFMGVFDTVGALGIPSFIEPLIGNGSRSRHLSLLQRNRMPNAGFPRNIENACHALAIDEFRPHFKPTLWAVTEDMQERVEQRWFIGAHSNIGGGYGDNLLSNRPLYWMYERAKAHGLHLSGFPSTHANVHLEEPVSDSYAGYRRFYKLVGTRPYYRPIGQAVPAETSYDYQQELPALNEIDPTQTIDSSVSQRVEENAHYKTPNLMQLSQGQLDELMKNRERYDEKSRRRAKL